MVLSSLAHVLWIGGATDAGKTTAAQILATRHSLQLYNYDRHDLRHHEHLAQTSPHYRDFLEASMDERWIRPTPEDLLQRALQSFRARFPLVTEDLIALSGKQTVVAEGFGLTPELLSPVLSNQRQAIWLVPTQEFKLASMTRRQKPSFKNETSDPERATTNLYRRDVLLAERIKVQAQSRDLRVYKVDGSLSAEAIATLIEHHFEPFLHGE